MPGALYPALPPRPGSMATSSHTPFTSLGSGGLSPPSSPPRRVVRDFKSFSASSGLSVANAPLGHANEGLQTDGDGTKMDADEELAQSVELRFAGISLEQVSLATAIARTRLDLGES